MEVPASPRDKVLVLFIGGFGQDQLDDVDKALETSFPHASFVRFAPKDGYQTDVSAYVNQSSYDYLVLIGHSWGTARIVQDSSAIPKVDLAVLYDPVAFDQGSLTLPSSIKTCITFPRMDILGPFKATIIGAHTEYPQPGGHSDGCHNPETFKTITTYLEAMVHEHTSMAVP